MALEVSYDYLDGLTELPAEDPLAAALALFASFTGALAPPVSPERDPPRAPAATGRAYLDALADAVRRELATSLLAGRRVARHAAAQRTAQAQSRLHSAPLTGDRELELWARPLAQQAGLDWREFLAGAAASVLACHALIVAAARPGATAAEAERLDGFYLRLCALSTLLDSVVDRERDIRAGADSLLRLYTDRGELGQSVRALAADARGLAETLPDGAHHLMIMVGVVSYYLSATGARAPFAAPVRAALRRELSPLIFPTLAVMRAWRVAKALRALTHGGGSARRCGRWRGCRRRT